METLRGQDLGVPLSNDPSMAVVIHKYPRCTARTSLSTAAHYTQLGKWKSASRGNPVFLSTEWWGEGALGPYRTPKHLTAFVSECPTERRFARQPFYR